MDDWDFGDQDQYQNKNRAGKPPQDAGGFTRIPLDTRNKYKELSSDSANLLIKEVAAQKV